MIKKFFYFLTLTLVIASCKTSNNNILFSTSRNGNSDIYLMDEEENKQVPLTTVKAEEWGPTWINDTEISFLRQTSDSI